MLIDYSLSGKLFGAEAQTIALNEIASALSKTFYKSFSTAKVKKKFDNYKSTYELWNVVSIWPGVIFNTTENKYEASASGKEHPRAKKYMYGGEKMWCELLFIFGDEKHQTISRTSTRSHGKTVEVIERSDDYDDGENALADLARHCSIKERIQLLHEGVEALDMIRGKNILLLIDSHLHGNFSTEEATVVFDLASHCLQYETTNTSYRQHKQVRTSSKQRSMASKEQVEILSDDSSSSDADIDVSMADQLNDEPQIDISSEVMLFRSAKSYQEYMKLIPIPTNRGSVIPFKSWVGLGSSIKQLYNQPLHYLTNVQLKKMDQERLGGEDEDVRLDTIIHPTKAETFIWLMEEIHRRTSSPHHLLQLWEANSKYHAFIDAIFPKLE